MANLRDLFDKPFAGPEVRLRYEAALGAFLVRFNGIENYARHMVQIVLAQQSRPDLWDSVKGDDLLHQLRYLKLLSISEPYLANVPFERIAKINTKRNMLAHSHFDQDLFSERFELVGKKSEPVPMTVAEVIALADEADELWNDLGRMIGELPNEAPQF